MHRATRLLAATLVAVLAAAVAVSAAAAGSLTVTSAAISGTNTVKYTLAWTSSAGGAVSGHPFDIKAGRLVQVKFVPGTSTAQPTDLYDVTLVDTDGVDVLAGAGANLSQTNSTVTVPQFGTGSNPAQTYFHDATEQLDLVVANAGATKGGTVILYVQ